MKPRINNLTSTAAPRQHTAPKPTRRPSRTKPTGSDRSEIPQEIATPQEDHSFEENTPTDQLTTFTVAIIDLIAASPKSTLENDLHNIISQNLKSFANLKRDYIEAVLTKRKQHAWAKELLAATQTLLDNPDAPEKNKHQLDLLSLNAVEQTMQLKYRLDTLRTRLEEAEQSIPAHVANYAKKQGYSDTIVQNLAKLTSNAIETY